MQDSLMNPLDADDGIFAMPAETIPRVMKGGMAEPGHLYKKGWM